MNNIASCLIVIILGLLIIGFINSFFENKVAEKRKREYERMLKDNQIQEEEMKRKQGEELYKSMDIHIDNFIAKFKKETEEDYKFNKKLIIFVLIILMFGLFFRIILK